MTRVVKMKAFSSSLQHFVFCFVSPLRQQKVISTEEGGEGKNLEKGEKGFSYDPHCVSAVNWQDNRA